MGLAKPLGLPCRIRAFLDLFGMHFFLSYSFVLVRIAEANLILHAPQHGRGVREIMCIEKKRERWAKQIGIQDLVT
jgi:hypothetical protein